MKKTFLSIFIIVGIFGFSDSFTLDNQISASTDISKMAIQWAQSEKEIEKENQALILQGDLDKNQIKEVPYSGKIKVEIPNQAQYFRILSWSKKDEKPKFHTNWVEIVPNKSYTLKSEHLVPTVLMAGMGC